MTVSSPNVRPFNATRTTSALWWFSYLWLCVCVYVCVRALWWFLYLWLFVFESVCVCVAEWLVGRSDTDTHPDNRSLNTCKLTCMCTETCMHNHTHTGTHLKNTRPTPGGSKAGPSGLGRGTTSDRRRPYLVTSARVSATRSSYSSCVYVFVRACLYQHI